MTKWISMPPHLSLEFHTPISSCLLLDLPPRVSWKHLCLKLSKSKLITIPPPTCYSPCVHSLIAKQPYYRSWSHTLFFSPSIQAIITFCYLYLNSILQISLLLCYHCPGPVLQPIFPGLWHLPSDFSPCLSHQFLFHIAANSHSWNTHLVLNPFQLLIPASSMKSKSISRVTGPFILSHSFLFVLSVTQLTARHRAWPTADTVAYWVIGFSAFENVFLLYPIISFPARSAE